MNSIRCNRCGKMFDSKGRHGVVCELCQMEREEAFQAVRALIKEFPGITAFEVNEVTGVPANLILRYIENGLIDVVKDMELSEEAAERIGIMINKVRETKPQLKLPETTTEKLDTIAQIAEEKEKFKWHDTGEG